MGTQLQWVSPAPPLRTGIANYSADMFEAVDGLWSIAAIPENGSTLPRYRTIQAVDAPNFKRDAPAVLHLGNSEYHDIAFSLANDTPAVLVLHDVFLHHARAAMAMRQGKSGRYWRELQEEYGPDGVAAGRALFAGQDPADLARFPMFEPFVRGARVTVVHSEYAAQDVLRRVPDADVRVVPMGIPIPATIDRQNARRALGLGASAFVICSITHVNPNKRIPAVLRAMRKLVVDVPEATLLLAGSGSDSELLRREIEILGLQYRVRQLGYVDDATARTIASAADACVNLRFPTAGETSASLLRLLGAGLPVLVSDAGASAELPDGVGLKIPVGERELEMLVAVLRELAARPQLRADAGHAALDFIVENHSMVNMVDGYRAVLNDTFGLDLPAMERMPHEAPVGLPVPQDRPDPRGGGVVQVAAAIGDLGLDDQPLALDIAGAAVAELGLDRDAPDTDAELSAKLVARVACPGCGGSIGADRICPECGAGIERSGNVLDLR